MNQVTRYRQMHAGGLSRDRSAAYVLKCASCAQGLPSGSSVVCAGAKIASGAHYKYSHNSARACCRLPGRCRSGVFSDHLSLCGQLNQTEDEPLHISKFRVTTP